MAGRQGCGMNGQLGPVEDSGRRAAHARVGLDGL